MSQALLHYLQRVQREYSTKIAAEHAYRPALKELLEAVDSSLNAVNDPKHIDAGAPDFIILRNRVPIAFVEAKDIGKDLDRAERDEQLQRYLKALPNLILTDYLEFRWFLNGEHQRTVTVGIITRGKIQHDNEGVQNLDTLLHDFIRAAIPTVNSARELAIHMADMAREIARLIENSLPDSEQLKDQKDSFENTLIPGLSNRQFADMYAQTLAYGLFAARIDYEDAPEKFTLQTAFWHLPETNPFLKELFQEIAPKLDDRVRWLVEALAKLLAHAKMDEILEGFGERTRTEDPIVHFYETFLAEYDPKLRELRGVYYTPEPLVKYIVRSVDYLLRTYFKRFDGLADTNTFILDPATGTGTFLYFVIQQIYKRMAGQEGIWDDYVQHHLLPRTYGFELLMASYAVAHMKLGIALKQTKYSFRGKQRLEIYLTNTLEAEIKTEYKSAFAGFITKEANQAAAVKRERPIMVVLGNPPYSGQSGNKGKWIINLIRDYYQLDGQPLGERNPKWLQDDYVKFIRFGQWRVEQTGGGILAFVTNHGYLDNPTFRGMRQQLMRAFDDIYILNLHGNSNKKETTPDGGKDENVFDIQQGVAIGIFVKHPDTPSNGDANIHYTDLWGGREGKYDKLETSDLSNTPWQILSPQSPFYLFVPYDIDLLGEYERGWKITEVMQVNSVGIATARDSLTIQWSQHEIMDTVQDFLSLPIETARAQYNLGEDARDWKVSLAQNDLRVHGINDSFVTPIHYRPFDIRFTYYTGQSRGFICMPRPAVMRHMLAGENVALITSRLTKGETFKHAQVTQNIVEVICMSPKTSNNGFVFPLYLYPDTEKPQMFDLSDWPSGINGRVPNFNRAFIEDLQEHLGLQFYHDGRGDLQATFAPEDVFHYIYAIFHSPTYRERYSEFLRIDFPRLPLTSDVELFRTLCGLGAELVDLHLMRSPALAKLITTFPKSSDNNNTVERGYPRYDEPNQRVYINKGHYFEGVPLEVWEFQIGGYQVLEKWLKDRRGRELSYDDIKHYQRIVVALQETIRLMDEIDSAIPAWPIA